MCHKLLKYETRYDCRAKCLHTVTLKFLPTICFLNNREENKKNPESENEPNQNWYEFSCASSLTKCLEGFDKMTGF